MGQNVKAAAPDLRGYVAQIAQELTERIEHQRDVLLKSLEVRQQQGQTIEYCPLIDCHSKKRLRDALREAILVLEDTRRSFKSRRLEELRLKLAALLAEEAL